MFPNLNVETLLLLEKTYLFTVGFDCYINSLQSLFVTDISLYSFIICIHSVIA